MALRTVGVKLTAEVGGYMASLRQAGTATKGFAAELDRAARAGRLDAVADQAGRMGLALAAGFTVAVAAAARFDKQMSAVSAATHASARDMEQLRAAALQAGKDTSFSATEAAQGIEELAKAGVSTAAILNGGLKGALDLAAAGGLEVAEAAEVAASAMTQFKLDSGQIPHLADLLAAGAGKAQGSVHDLGMALSQGGLVAAQMGLSVEDTTGTLAAFASAGLLGSDAGTSLKNALLFLANPTDKAAGLMEELGIQAYDASGQFVGITSLAGQLKTQLGGLTQQQRNAALSTIFGADAIRAASILYEQGADGIQQWIDKTNDAGFAAQTAQTRMDNLAGDIERLTGSLETLAIESSTGATSGLRTLVQGADNLVGSLSGIPAPVQSAVVVIAGITGATLLAAAGTAKLRAATADALTELGKTGPVGQRAASTLERFQVAAGRVAVALAAVQTASALMGDSLNPQTEVLGKRMLEFTRSGEAGGEAARLFGDDLGKLDTALKDIADTGVWSDVSRGLGGLAEGISGLGSVVDDSLQHSRERLTALDQALASMVQSGRGQEAARIFDEITKRAAEQGVSVAELNRVLPGYAAAVELAGSASDTAAGQVGEVGAAAQDAKDKVDELKRAFDDLFNAAMDIDRATIAYKEGVAKLKEELADGARTLKLNTQEGRDNASAVLDQIQKIKDLRQARIEHGMALDEADGKYVKDIASLRATLIQLGYNATAVDALIGKYQAIPGQVGTIITADTQPALTAAKSLIARINNMKARIKVEAEPSGGFGGGAHTGFGYSTGNRWGGVYEHAAAGLLREAQVASPMGPARYAWAEPATGGELFAPRYGDMARTRAMVGYAVENWWGGWQSFAPPMSSAAASRGPVTVNNNFTIHGGQQSPQQIAREVSRIIGREADIYSR